MTFNWDEVDRIRQWFDSLEDTNTAYLVREDYVLAKKIFKKLEMRVPGSILEGEK